MDQTKHNRIPTPVEVSKIIATHHGIKNTVLLYANQANKAAGRAKLAISDQNTLMLAAEVQTMVDNIDALIKFLSPDDIAITEK